tara:strand:+ start:6423 stop:7772 length:1350 start_codon:yes stop_codon:yes gene_type:complete
MRLLFLDVYKRSNSRISKDTAGGYGTENNMGDGLFGKFISSIIKKTIFWPNLSFIQLLEEFNSTGNECVYIKKIGPSINLSEDWDAIFVCSSIVCFETEIEACINMKKQTDSPIFLCGSISQFIKEKIPEGVTLLTGNYEFLLQRLDTTGESLNDISNKDIINVIHGKPENLKLINWSRESLKGTRNLILGNTKFFFPYITTRGCPYSCQEYCTYPLAQGRKILQEPVESVVKKLKIISNNFPQSHIVFRDPVFSINMKHTKDLLNQIGEANLNIDFSAELHLKNVDDEFIELCKKAKFTGLKFGIESAHEEVRDSVKRFSIDNDEQMKTIKKINDANIRTVGMFILAQPTDNRDSCLSTIDYACKLNLSIAQFSIFTPYPGTPYYVRGESEKSFSRYEECNQYNLVYKHETISKREARQLLEKAYYKFIISKVRRGLFNLFPLNLFVK